MKKTMTFLLYFIAIVSLFSQVPEFEWSSQIGGVGTDRGRSIATDYIGNVYVTGTFVASADFDPGPDTYNLISAGGHNVYIAKYSTDKQLIWAVSIPGVEDGLGGDNGNGITTDMFGNVYITGGFKGAIDFDPGSETYNLTSYDDEEYDIFILKLDTNGNFIWARSLGNSGVDYGNAITVDGNGNVYTAGFFVNTTDFDPGSEIHNINPNGSADAFILKLNSDGDFVWATNLGGSGADWSQDIVLDEYSNVYTTGRMNGIGLFISKLNSDGEVLWTKTTDGPSTNMWGDGIAVDEDGNVYTTGSFQQTVDFDPGQDTFNLVSNGATDIFVLKLDTNGDFIWAKSVGGAAHSAGWFLALDNFNNVYTVGFFQESIDFDPGSGTYYISSGEGNGTFILKLNTDGSFVWAGAFTGNGLNSGESIALDHWNNIYTTGFFSDSSDFDPGTEIYDLTSNGNTDIFLHKLHQPCPVSPQITSLNNTLTICPGEAITLNTFLPASITATSYTWSTGDSTPQISVIPDTSTIYSVVANYIFDSTACSTSTYIEVMLYDSLAITLTEDTELCQHEEALLEATGGAAYQWSTGDSTGLISINPESNQVYSVTVTDANGCSAIDSVMVSVFTLADTTLVVMTTCDSLAAGVNTFTFADQNGCDSIVIESITYLPIPAMPVAPADLVIGQNEPPFTITVEEVPNTIGYSWSIPAGVQILSGIGTNALTLNWNGMATGGTVCVSAVNDCGSSEAACLEVMVDTTSAVMEVEEKGYRVFPNPADEVVQVHFDFAQYKFFEEGGSFVIALLDALGRIVIPEATYYGRAEIETKYLPVGRYWLFIKVAERDPFWGQVEVMR